MPKSASRLLFPLLSAVTICLLISCGVNPGSGDPAPTIGHLAVADFGNNRVLIYDAPFTTNESASIVVGQPDFSSVQINQSQGWFLSGANTLLAPEGLAVDANGDLWIADWGNCRVLRYQPPFKTNMNASLVLGKPDFNSGGAICTDRLYQPGAAGMLGPTSVAFDSQGRLWVADGQAGRVTEYVPPFTSGMKATIAIGQPNLQDVNLCNGENDTLGSDNSEWPPPPTANTLCGPYGLIFDSRGNLWIADAGNGRVLEFVPPFSTGMSASLELGEPDFRTSEPCYPPGSAAPVETSASHFCGPSGMVFDSRGDLWIADSYYGRVLEFVPPFSTGMSASLVLGEPDFTQTWNNSANVNGVDNQPPTASSLSTPSALLFDEQGDLFVTDGQFNRLLVYTPPFTNGISASVVIGQPNMTTRAKNQDGTPGANTLFSPWGGVEF